MFNIYSEIASASWEWNSALKCVFVDSKAGAVSL